MQIIFLLCPVPLTESQRMKQPFSSNATVKTKEQMLVTGIIQRVTQTRIY